MAGLDLHSNNIVAGLVDLEGRRIAHRKVGCTLKEVKGFLDPYRERINTIAVESTYNWYWLVDGLQSDHWNVVLANPAKIQQYSGLKHSDDKSDAFWLAEMLRLNILPTGYIYDAATRPVRDLLRRRMSLVQHRTGLLLSFKSLYTRTTGQIMGGPQFNELDAERIQKLYEHPANRIIALAQKGHIEQLSQSIEQIEKYVLKIARDIPCYEGLLGLPGIGRILGMTITMESGDLDRFPAPGNFASYCRMVDAQRTSNDKHKGDNNQKCGNPYLSWAYIEGANFARRFDQDCRRWFDRKAAKVGKVIATKALGCKLAKASWHVMVKGTAYDAALMFPGTQEKSMK
jgi:transposase